MLSVVAAVIAGEIVGRFVGVLVVAGIVLVVWIIVDYRGNACPHCGAKGQSKESPICRECGRDRRESQA